MFLTKEAVRLALPGVADAVACDGCPPLARLFEQFAEGGGELLVCPICFNSKKLDEAQLVDNATAGRRDSALAVDRRRRGDRLQLLTIQARANRAPGSVVTWRESDNACSVVRTTTG